MVLSIEFDNSFTVKFQVLDTPMAQLWLERMTLRNQYPLDHPDRFYGFNSQEQEEAKALTLIRQSCRTINYFKHIIERDIESVYDQDTLNYLHNIFERYHGLLDKQDQEFLSYPPDVRKALADLNINVHRCESVARGSKPRFVCTWYGLPKTKTLTDELMQEYGTVNPKWGSVCLNYAEIGKTLEDLTKDNDNYIGDDAFRPFNHYSADFVVRFYEDSINEVAQRVIAMTRYYCEHKDFFEQHGYKEFAHPRLLPLRFPVAELIETMPRDELLKQIKQHQLITQVNIE